MVAKVPTDVQGLEYDWLASDALGHVALFTTAGGGFTPLRFLQDTEAHAAALDAVFAAPARTSPLRFPPVAGTLRNPWRLAAERGLFAFDSDAFGGPYRLVALPEHPVVLADLPDAAAGVAAALNFPGLRFDQVNPLTRADLRQHS